MKSFFTNFVFTSSITRENTTLQGLKLKPTIIIFQERSALLLTKNERFAQKIKERIPNPATYPGAVAKVEGEVRCVESKILEHLL